MGRSPLNSKNMLGAFKDQGIALAHADAHGHQGVAAFSAVQFSRSGQSNARAGHTQGVTKGDGAAVWIDAVVPVVEAHGPRTGQGLRCEGFVEFNDIHVVELQAGFGQGDFARWDWANPHNSGLDTGHAPGDDSGQRGEAMRFEALAARNKKCGTSIVDHAGISGGHSSGGAEGGAESSQSL